MPGILRCFILSISLFISFIPLSSEEKSNTAQSILSVATGRLRLINGYWRGTLVHEGAWNRVFQLEFTVAARDSQRLFIFKSIRRGVELKVLSKKSGQTIYVWNPVAFREQKLQGTDRLISVAETSLSFFDLLGYSFTPLFDPVKVEDVTDDDRLRKRIQASYPGGGRLIQGVFIVSKAPEENDDKWRLDRIDFYREGNVLYKSAEFFYGEQILRETRNASDLIKIPYRITILQLDSGEKTTLNYNSVNEKIQIPDAIFSIRNLRY